MSWRQNPPVADRLYRRVTGVPILTRGSPIYRDYGDGGSPFSWGPQNFMTPGLQETGGSLPRAAPPSLQKVGNTPRGRKVRRPSNFHYLPGNRDRLSSDGIAPAKREAPPRPGIASAVASQEEMYQTRVAISDRPTATCGHGGSAGPYLSSAFVRPAGLS